jgi:hypothetical protein
MAKGFTHVQPLESRCTWRLIVASTLAVGCGGATISTTATDASVGSEASSLGVDAACLIQTSTFDHSCNVDSDCVSVAGNLPVASGNYCASGCMCADDAINRSAAAEYITVVSRTPNATGAVPRVGCFCGATAGPCCVAGQCSVVCSLPCSRPPCSTSEYDSGPVEAVDAAAELMPDGSVFCSSQIGPFDASAQFGDAAIYSCGPSEACVPYNGGWGCCMRIGPEQTFCRQVPINDK